MPTHCFNTNLKSNSVCFHHQVSLKTLRAYEAAAAADDYGEYVTLAHVMPEPMADVRRGSPATELACCRAGFVHMDELPVGSLERKKPTGARVTLNAEGKVIYTSDSLKRRKKIHTTNTFEPGPCVSANVVQLPVNKNNVMSQVRNLSGVLALLPVPGVVRLAGGWIVGDSQRGHSRPPPCGHF